MAVRNRIKEFLENRPDSVTGKSGTSAYRFWKETNLSRPTAYRLVSDPTYVPAGEVLDKICSAYQVQPGELLVWKAGDGTDEGSSVEQDKQVQINQSRETIDDKSPLQRQRARSFLAVVSEVLESA